jgi:hypothetical protein
VYGIATGAKTGAENVVGVAGRSMGGIAIEPVALEKVVDTPIGVLGQSTKGPGVRGHGGQLLKESLTGPPTLPIDAAPGGVFSSGRLQDRTMSFIFPSGALQTVGLDALAQAQLVPSVAAHQRSDTVSAVLPSAGRVGDLYMVATPLHTPAGFYGPAQLYICTAVVPEPGDVANPPGPRWQAVQLGPLLRGGPVS